MMKRLIGLLALCFSCLLPLQTGAAGPDDVLTLPKRSKAVDADLFTALEQRASGRQFDADKTVSPQALADLLWAANGVNRANGKRTAPAARGIQLVEIYVTNAQGVYRYRPETPEKLQRVVSQDVRKALYAQTGMADAPVTLLFVYDGNVAVSGMPDRRKEDYAWNAIGAMEQNVALTAAVKRLSTVVVGSIKTDALRLPQGKTILIAMPIGHAK